MCCFYLKVREGRQVAGVCFDVNVIDVTEVNKDTQVYDIFIQLWPNWKEEGHREDTIDVTYMSRRPFVYTLYGDKA